MLDVAPSPYGSSPYSHRESGSNSSMIFTSSRFRADLDRALTSILSVRFRVVSCGRSARTSVCGRQRDFDVNGRSLTALSNRSLRRRSQCHYGDLALGVDNDLDDAPSNRDHPLFGRTASKRIPDGLHERVSRLEQFVGLGPREFEALQFEQSGSDVGAARRKRRDPLIDHASRVLAPIDRAV